MEALVFSAVVIIILRFVSPSTKAFKRNLGVVLLILAVPAGLLTEFAVTGCCGAPRSAFAGGGYVLGMAMIVIGMLLVRNSRKP